MNSLLRVRHKGEHAHVGFVELFFDLVFVFAITQVSHTLLAHLTPLGGVQAAMILGALWWAWIDTSWVTNWLDPETTAVRVMLFFLMGIGLVLATTLPEAFGERRYYTSRTQPKLRPNPCRLNPRSRHALGPILRA